MCLLLRITCRFPSLDYLAIALPLGQVCYAWVPGVLGRCELRSRQLYFARLYHFPDVVVADINVFGPLFLDCIGGYKDSSLVVSAEWNGADIKPHFTQ